MVQNSNKGNRGYLSDAVNEDGLYPLWGVAIGNNDITVGSKTGEPKLWRPDVLEEAADTLEGKHIVVNHENRDAYEVIGEITEVKFDEGKGVIYRGQIDDAELARKIDHGWLEVSPRIIHSKAHEELEGVKIPEYIKEFDNLSIVRRGAAGSNEVNLGNVEELSVEELQESFDSNTEDEEVVEYQSVVEPEEMQDGFNYARWMYKDQNGAVGATDKFGCEGTHAKEIEGETWYMPCDSHDKFLEGVKQLLEKGEMSESDEVDDTDEVEELQLSEARTPSYDETETTSWGDIPADTLSYWTDALGYDDVGEVDDLTSDQKSEIAQHSLLGDPDGSTIREIRFFPVVNGNTGDLNRGALEAVRSGRGQSADIPESAYESAYSVAGRLLNEEFGADVEEEMEEEELQSGLEEKKRLAGQISSWALLTRDEALEFLQTIDPNVSGDVEPFVTLMGRVFDDVDEEKLRDVLYSLGIGNRPTEEDKNPNVYSIRLEDGEDPEGEVEEAGDDESSDSSTYSRLQKIVGR